MRLETSLFISDHQIPDHNEKVLSLQLQLIKDLKPDKIFIVGDFLNFTKISKYLVADYYVSLKQEIKEGTRILDQIVSTARKAKRDVEITWLYGNHEQRLQEYLTKADQLQDLEVNGEKLVSIEHIFELKKKGIKYLHYKEKHLLHGVSIEHGVFVSGKAGQTATKHMERRGRSVIHGHTHRAGLVYRRIGDEMQFGMELGCSCNLNPSPRYTFEPDWIHGMGIVHYSPETKQVYPQLIPIVKHSFVYAGKLYRA